MIDIDKLEALAKAATPGPWRGDRIDSTVKYDIVGGDYPNEYRVVCHGDNGNACDGGYGFTNEQDESYVLAANPAAVLELIAEVRRLREDAERLDYLDARNDRKNQSYKTKYGWGLTENHNRIALEDHHFPVLSVRQAIDAARANSPRDCPKCSVKNLAAGDYCKDIGCPLNPAKEKA